MLSTGFANLTGMLGLAGTSRITAFLRGLLNGLLGIAVRGTITAFLCVVCAGGIAGKAELLAFSCGLRGKAESVHFKRFLHSLPGIAGRRRITAYLHGLHRMCLLNNCRVCKSEWVAWYCWQAQNHCIFAWFAQDVFAEQL